MHDDNLVLQIEGKPKFYIKPGKVRGKKAVNIVGITTPDVEI